MILHQHFLQGRSVLKRNGFIVESLIDGKRSNATASSKVSALSEISMYTEGEDIPLAEVFTKMYAYTEGKPGISPKESNDRLKEFFGAVVTDYDRERVHVSDIKTYRSLAGIQF